MRNTGKKDTTTVSLTGYVWVPSIEYLFIHSPKVDVYVETYSAVDKGVVFLKFCIINLKKVIN